MTGYVEIGKNEAAQKITPDLDIYRAANVLIKRHGENAAIHAAMKADEMLVKAGYDGQAVWIRID